MKEEIITQVILAALSIVSVLMCGSLIPYLVSKTSKEKIDRIEYWAGKAVEAIEVFYKKEGIENAGKEKKKFVMDFLKKHGAKLSDEQLSVLIDSTVENIINKPLEDFFLK